MVLDGEILREPLQDTGHSKGRFLDMEDQGICLVIAAKNVGKYMCFFIKGTGLF